MTIEAVLRKERRTVAVYRTFDQYLKRFFPDEWEKKHAPMDLYEAAVAMVRASAEKHMRELGLVKPVEAALAEKGPHD